MNFSKWKFKVQSSKWTVQSESSKGTSSELTYIAYVCVCNLVWKYHLLKSKHVWRYSL